MFFRNYELRIRCLDKRLKSPVSDDSSTSNMVNGPKHCRILDDSTFIIFTDQCEGT